jgi:hypothetical protein
MYLGRSEQDSPHSTAIKHVLHARGDQQLFDVSRFALWRLALHRLLTRQLLLGEQPDPEQIEWVSKLNTDRPDVHISADVLHMNVFSAQAKELVRTADGDVPLSIRLARARQLADSIKELLAAIETWTSQISPVWMPRIDNPDDFTQTQEVDELRDFPIPKFKCPQMLSYHDVWLVCCSISRSKLCVC